MIKFLFNKGKPKIEVEYGTTFNITIDEKGIIEEARSLAREEHISKLADDFLQDFFKMEPEQKINYSIPHFDPYMGARERGYQSCYNDMKEKIMDRIREVVVYE